MIRNSHPGCAMRSLEHGAPLGGGVCRPGLSRGLRVEAEASVGSKRRETDWTD